MITFDIIVAAGKAYQTSWRERRYLLKLAIVPFVLKCFCYLLAFSLGYQGDHIPLTLILLPAFFAEGWMLSHYARLIVLNHRWPFKPSGDLQKDLPVLRTRARGVMGGILVYVLINMAMGAILAFMMQYVPAEGQDPKTVAPEVATLMFVSMIASFWAFRLTWLYIPYALNLNAKYYLGVVKGFFISLPMIGLWLMCIMPFFLVMQVVGGFIHDLVKGAAGDDVGSFALIIMIVAMDTVKNIVATAGMTYGLQELFEKQKR